MRTIITYLLSFSILPVALSAQPTVTINEYYHIGDVIQMVNCDPSIVTAGAAGANVTWDFTGLSSTGGMLTTQILNDTSTQFSTSNIMEIMPDGTVWFLNENNDDTYVDGMYNPATHLTTTYEIYHDSKRPFTYNTNYADSYKVTIPSVLFGTGLIFAVGDAYGTLMLPGATYSNVLRIKKIRTEWDTSGMVPGVSVSTSYMWFDTLHAAPLLRIDSSLNTSGSSQRVAYQTPTTGIREFAAGQGAYNGYLDKNEHLFVNGFEAGKNYQVTLYNVIGNTIFTESLAASGSQQRFDVGRQLAPGIYVVRITAKGDPNGTAVIKLIKQE